MLPLPLLLTLPLSLTLVDGARGASSSPSSPVNMSKTAFVVGASGAVGTKLVDALIECGKFSKVVLIGRRNLELANQPDFVEQKTVDFEKLDEFADEFKGFDVGFCTLGTTRGKSGAKMFYRVDHDYVLNTAKLAKEGGCPRFMLVTSMGSDATSSMLYPKTKGEVENDIEALGFDTFVVARPGFLEGHRNESRIAEILSTPFVKVIGWFTNKWSIPMEKVAKALVVSSLDSTLNGTVKFENVALHELADKYAPSA